MTCKRLATGQWQSMAFGHTRCREAVGANVLKQIVRIRQALAVKKRRGCGVVDWVLSVGPHGEILIGE